MSLNGYKSITRLYLFDFNYGWTMGLSDKLDYTGIINKNIRHVFGAKPHGVRDVFGRHTGTNSFQYGWPITVCFRSER